MANHIFHDIPDFKVLEERIYKALLGGDAVDGFSRADSYNTYELEMYGVPSGVEASADLGNRVEIHISTSGFPALNVQVYRDHIEYRIDRGVYHYPGPAILRNTIMGTDLQALASKYNHTPPLKTYNAVFHDMLVRVVSRLLR